MKLNKQTNPNHEDADHAFKFTVEAAGESEFEKLLQFWKKCSSTWLLLVLVLLRPVYKNADSLCREERVIAS